MHPGARFGLRSWLCHCVAWGKLLNFSELWFLHCEKKGKKNSGQERAPSEALFVLHSQVIMLHVCRLALIDFYKLNLFYSWGC